MKDKEKDEEVEDESLSNDESSSKSSESSDENSEHSEEGSSYDELPKYIVLKDEEIQIPTSMKSKYLNKLNWFFRMGWINIWN